MGQSPVGPPDPADLRVWGVESGRLALHLFPSVLEAAGLEVRDLRGAIVPTGDEADGWDEVLIDEHLFFDLAEGSELRVLRNADGEFQPYGVLGGSLHVDGGFTLASVDTGRSVPLHDFGVHARWVRTDGPGGEPDPDVFYVAGAGAPTGGVGAADLFRVCYAKVYFPEYDGSSGGTHGQAELRIRAWDLVIEPPLAERLGDPGLAGRVIGSGAIRMQARQLDEAWEPPPGQNIFSPWKGTATATAPGVGGGTIDMALGGLQSLVVLGHEGVFGAGRTGFSLTTIACNVGDVNIPWRRAMDPAHPGIVMALYRDHQGRFEQVGVSWVKHGFFAQSGSSCTTCQSPTNGTELGVGCSDTYGSANNGDRFWLGPRSEWDAHRATWTCEGSFFDGTPVDCERDENGSGNNPVDHRLEAFDEDLATPGATYYYEAMYLVQDDANLFDNIASRRTVIVDEGDAFFATTPIVSQGNPVVPGPAIQRWGQKRTQAGLGSVDGDHDGEVILAVQVTPLAGGQWRYEYALFNWTLDRRVDSFSIPLSMGLAAERSFRDIDEHSSNDWVPAKQDGNLAWTFPGAQPAGHKVAGPLEFGTLYNFGFTSDRPPAVRDAVLGIHEDGPGGDLLSVETLAPDVLALTADQASPVAGTSVQLKAQGGSVGAVIAALAVDGMPLTPALFLTPVPVRFVLGEATLDVVVPNDLAGSTVSLVAADVSALLSIDALSNVHTLAIR